jgi:hypothetical protein
MKMQEGFVMREVAGQYVVVAVGEASKTFHGMIKLNSTGKDIWEGLEKGLTEEEIVGVLVEKYDVQNSDVKNDVQEFLKQMREVGIIVNE